MIDMSTTLGMLGLGFLMLAIGSLKYAGTSNKGFDLSDTWYTLFLLVALLFFVASAFSLSLPGVGSSGVASVNNQSGALTLIGQNGISVNTNGNVIGISGSLPSPTIVPLRVTANTAYQNTNATAPLYIYSITHSAPLTAYVGSAPSSMSEVAYEDGGSVTISSIVYSLAGYNMSTTIVVPPKWYYKFNFTNATFHGEIT
jgi:hypothetical protein